MFGRNHESRFTPLIIVLAVIFSVGLVLGTISFFHIPAEVVDEARRAFDPTNIKSLSFFETFKSNLIVELGWLLVIWMLGSISVTAPFASAVMSVRGFLMGFSIAFVLTGEDNVFKILLTNILPQCVTALPVMTAFSMICVRFSIEEKRSDKIDAKHILMYGIFVFLITLAALVESVLTKVFINIS